MRDRAIREMMRLKVRVRAMLRSVAVGGPPARQDPARLAALTRGALLAVLALSVLALSASSAVAGCQGGATRAVVSQRTALVPPAAAPVFALDVSPRARLLATCMPLPVGPRLWTPAQLAHPRLSGLAYDALGRVSRCEWTSLEVPLPASGAPQERGQVILVSLSQQWLWAYQDGRLVFANPITSGRPELATPSGAYHVQAKVADSTFFSPWGPWSPYYYSPEHVNYALLFRAGGYFLHDAPWRAAFGPGSNTPHTDPGGGHETGSHGCVNMTTAAAGWLYHWASIGATVLIVA